jgi:hypothetical protein
LVLSAYLDFFKFAYLKYLIDAPSEGFGYLAQMTYQPDKRTRFLVQIRQENKGKNYPKTTTVSTTIKRNFLLQYDKTITSIWSFQSRIQGSLFNYSGDNVAKGLALMQDATADLGKLSLTARIAIFNTDDYENRQYAYENDVQFAFSFPAYYGHGIRHYLMAQYKINNFMPLYVGAEPIYLAKTPMAQV